MFVDIVKIVCIYLLIDNASSSLLSRIRNRHEYIPDADLEVIRSLDDKTYEDLMNEIPILRQVFKDDPGLKLMVIGPFMKGCFKRFVDVGTLYTARGCRGLYHPWRSYTRSFASHRLAKLEILTRGFDDRCVSSPEASLTPFSRDISLFVRYHVCVCSKPYCNLAALHHIVHVYHTILLLFCSRMYVLVYNLI
ncbi:PREDICTED: uncharacterized protein LOC106125610 isoform X2 [Papilio xuthus]|uniref:Uncharacterized protein LOC106125610 isoform X2 n=1 Tax=Papilio xuthus TaxID=66420 RepID=A0AAJ6ZSE5_PAPXU|nr:PREDICTED: uncharacterized protein LOC106125610 isoform X2 [Papilio xuthus]